MKIKMKMFASLTMLFAVFPAFAADYNVQFIPPFPAPAQAVIARVSSTTGPSCLPPETSVTTIGTAIALRLDYTDTCASGNPIASRDYPIGSPSAGSYTFLINSCQNNPPPLPNPCTIGFQGALAVGFISATPTASWGAYALLVLGIIICMARQQSHNPLEASAGHLRGAPRACDQQPML